MLTFFAIPKAFTGQFDIIQRNAIRSWTLLEPRPEVLLLGDDPGTTEVAAELGARHIPTVPRNRYGTPLTNGIFALGQQHASHPLCCYINSDIILMSDFMAMVRQVDQQFAGRPFLAVGRKTNVVLTELLPFEDPSWEYHLRALARTQGKFVTYDADFFLFRPPMFQTMPGFAIGRCFWTQWLMYDTVKRGIPVIDVTPVVLSVESRHDYSHVVSTGGAKRMSGIEYEANRRLFKGCQYYTALDATQILTPEGLVPRPWRNRLHSLYVRLEYFIYFLLKGTLYPYSLPLVLILRMLRAVCQALQGLPRQLRRSPGPLARSSEGG